jgi:hypothetical protein
MIEEGEVREESDHNELRKFTWRDTLKICKQEPIEAWI